MLYNSHDITLVDCTLRDGGYYNNWEFAPEFVHAYIQQCIQLGIDVVELGYIRFTKNEYGTFGNLTKENLLAVKKLLKKNDEISFAIMLNAQDMYNYEAAHIVNKLQDLCVVDKDLVRCVRIAVNYQDLPQCLNYINLLQEQGFNLCLNIMQIELATEEQLLQCINYLKDLNTLIAIYLADSFGSFLPTKLEAVIRLFQQHISTPLGFHGHNNLGLALVNSLCAINNGVKWLDTTMYGMGRGAGNTQTEQFLPLVKTNISKEALIKLYEFINLYLQPLKEQYQWGTNALYGVSGLEKIHPFYIQVPQQQKIDTQKLISALKLMSRENLQKFSPDLLDLTLSKLY